MRSLVQPVCLPCLYAQDGWTSLLLAAKKSHIEVVQCLLDHGADVNAANQVPVVALLVLLFNGWNIYGRVNWLFPMSCK